MPENPDQPVTENQDVPDILKVPEGHVLLLRAYGRGVQKYACPVSAVSKPVAPHAILLASDEDGRGYPFRGTHLGSFGW